MLLPAASAVRMLRQVEGLLRQSRPTAALLRGAGDAPSTWSLVAAVLVLGAAYGLCMGLYAVLYGKAYTLLHLALVMTKVPALFLLTLAVTCPSLHVFSALARSSLRFRETVRLLLAASATSLAVLASFGPVTVFFTFCTTSHPFMQLLNTVLFGVAGIVGVVFVRRSLTELLGGDAGARPAARTRLAAVFTAWIAIYSAVGAQMGWILRPFVGTPHLEQTAFRGVRSNIFYGVIEALRYL